MKKIILMSILLAALLLLFGCSRKMGGGLTSSSPQAMFAEAVYDKNYAMEMDGAGFSETVAGVEGQSSSAFRDMSNLYGRTQTADQSTGSDSSDSISADLTRDERKLVKRADISIRVENLEKAASFVNDMLKRYDAYPASTIIDENHFSYFLRVPSPVYDAFLAETDGIGRVLRRTESIEDVSLRYYDLEGRLATKRELLKTYQSYLGRARNIEEILSVEARIADLQNEIDGTGKQLRELVNRVDYATVSLSLLGPVSSLSKRGDTFGTRLKNMFSGFGGFLSGLFFVIVGIVIYGVPILLIAALLFLLLFGRIGVMKKLWRLAKGAKG